MFHRASFQQRSEIERVDITETSIFAVAASNHKELVADESGRVESTGAGFHCIFLEFYLAPTLTPEIENPQIVKIGNALSSKNY